MGERIIIGLSFSMAFMISASWWMWLLVNQPDNPLWFGPTLFAFLVLSFCMIFSGGMVVLSVNPTALDEKKQNDKPEEREDS